MDSPGETGRIKSSHRIVTQSSILFVAKDMVTLIPPLASVVLVLTAMVIYGSWITISSDHD
jgi:hypothetical protein